MFDLIDTSLRCFELGRSSDARCHWLALFVGLAEDRSSEGLGLGVVLRAIEDPRGEVFDLGSRLVGGSALGERAGGQRLRRGGRRGALEGPCGLGADGRAGGFAIRHG